MMAYLKGTEAQGPSEPRKAFEGWSPPAGSFSQNRAPGFPGAIFLRNWASLFFFLTWMLDSS